MSGSGVMWEWDHPRPLEWAEYVYWCQHVLPRGWGIASVPQEKEPAMGALTDRIKALETELAVTDTILQERSRVLLAIPECELHGPLCVPHALEWVSGVLAHIATLESDNKRLREENFDLILTVNDLNTKTEGGNDD